MATRGIPVEDKSRVGHGASGGEVDRHCGSGWAAVEAGEGDLDVDVRCCNAAGVV